MSLVDEKKQTKTIDIYNFYCVFRIQFLFKPKSGEQLKDHKFYRNLYPQIIEDIDVSIIYCLINVFLT
jgi:hypothetical protein